MFAICQAVWGAVVCTLGALPPLPAASPPWVFYQRRSRKMRVWTWGIVLSWQSFDLGGRRMQDCRFGGVS